MSIRSFIFNTLTGYAPLSELVGQRVYASESIMDAQQTKPFLVYRMGADPKEPIFDDPDIVLNPHRQFFQVWVHDDRPSYLRIDNICDLVQAAFRSTPTSASDMVIWVSFKDRSDDFDDVVLDTVFRYLRFEAAMSQ